MSQRRLIISGVVAVALLFLVIVGWYLFVPPYNVPKFENIENNETGFLVPQDQQTSDQLHFESAEYLRDKKVAAKRVQIPRRWIQKGWLYTNGEYLDTVRLIKVNRASIIRNWTQDPVSGTSENDDAITAQSKDNAGIRIAFTCTAFIPEIGPEYPEGAEHFLYYYKGDTLEHVLDQEVRAKVQTAAADFCAKYTSDMLRGTQHELVQAVREDVIPFFKKRGIAITNLGLGGGFHYVNQEIQKSVDNAIVAQQLKVAALAMQEKEKVEQETKLQNQKIQNDTMKLEAEGKAVAKAAELEGLAKAKLAADRVDAEAAKVQADGKAAATRVEADAEAYRMSKLNEYKDFVMGLKQLDIEKAWRALWQGGVPSIVIGSQGGNHNVLPVLPLPVTPTTPEPKK